MCSCSLSESNQAAAELLAPRKVTLQAALATILLKSFKIELF